MSSTKKKKRIAIAVVTALSAATLILFGGRINTAVVHLREKYIDAPIARRVMKAREQRSDQIELPAVIQSPIMPKDSGGNGAHEQPYRPDLGRSMMRGGSVVLTD
ncbi:MAG: hypothetical protein IJ723_06920 [Ruminococcus sp.]|nr:hypothetical protein [Ruminococcus sp.]